MTCPRAANCSTQRVELRYQLKTVLTTQNHSLSRTIESFYRLSEFDDYIHS